MNRIKSFGISLALAIATVIGYIPANSSAIGAATLSLTGSGSSYQINATFPVSIYENSGAETVNVVQSDVSFDASKLQFVSIDAGGSAFGIDAYSANTGNVVTIARGVSGGATVTGNKLVATINFKALAGSGTSSVSFLASSKIYRSTDNTDIWNGVRSSASYSFTTPAPAPTPTPSPTPTPTPKPAPVAPAPVASSPVTTTPTVLGSGSETPKVATVETTPTTTSANTEPVQIGTTSGNGTRLWSLFAIIAAIAIVAISMRRNLAPAKSAVVYKAPEINKSSATKKKTASKSTTKKPSAKSTKKK